MAASPDSRAETYIADGSSGVRRGGVGPHQRDGGRAFSLPDQRRHGEDIAFGTCGLVKVSALPASPVLNWLASRSSQQDSPHQSATARRPDIPIAHRRPGGGAITPQFAQ